MIIASSPNVTCVSADEVSPEQLAREREVEMGREDLKSKPEGVRWVQCHKCGEQLLICMLSKELSWVSAGSVNWIPHVTCSEFAASYSLQLWHGAVLQL